MACTFLACLLAMYPSCSHPGNKFLLCRLSFSAWLVGNLRVSGAVSIFQGELVSGQPLFLSFWHGCDRGQGWGEQQGDTVCGRQNQGPAAGRVPSLPIPCGTEDVSRDAGLSGDPGGIPLPPSRQHLCAEVTERTPWASQGRRDLSLPVLSLSRETDSGL